MGLFNRIWDCTRDFCRCWKRCRPERWFLPHRKPYCPASLTSLRSPPAILSFFLLFTFVKDWRICRLCGSAVSSLSGLSWLLYEGFLNYSPTLKLNTKTPQGHKITWPPALLLLLVSITVPLLHVCHALKLISLAQWVRHGQPKDPSLSFSHSVAHTHTHICTQLHFLD